MLAAFEAACCAANGVPLRDPRKPSEPELFHDRTFPFGSVMVTIVLLNDAWMCTMPNGTCLRSFFLKVFFLPFLSGAAAPVVPAAASGFAINVFYPVLCLCGGLFLNRNRSLARALTGACVGMGALSADRQIAAVTISAIGTDFDQPFDVQLDFLAQIAF